MDLLQGWGGLFLKFVISLILFLTWLFFSVHAMQRIEDPRARAGWFCLLVFTFWIAPVFYYFLCYRQFKKEGKGGWIFRE
ncbi:MAG: hypothetical protein CMO55_17205 [Verrucomicrobiales bacterium]|nr:hypothetical protein [Verrucomicrobiales bacterium]